MFFTKRPKSAQWYPPLDDCGSANINSGDRQNITVHEDAKNSWTGLYDANGNEVHRSPNKVGF